jgi:hypothetical protein
MIADQIADETARLIAKFLRAEAATTRAAGAYYEGTADQDRIRAAALAYENAADDIDRGRWRP